MLHALYIYAHIRPHACHANTTPGTHQHHQRGQSQRGNRRTTPTWSSPQRAHRIPPCHLQPQPLPHQPCRRFRFRLALLETQHKHGTSTAHVKLFFWCLGPSLLVPPHVDLFLCLRTSARSLREGGRRPEREAGDQRAIGEGERGRDDGSAKRGRGREFCVSGGKGGGDEGRDKQTN